METLMEYLPALLPLIIIEVGLALFALVHVLRHPHYRHGSKGIWIVVVILVQFLGPIAYFVFGRGEEE